MGNLLDHPTDGLVSMWWGYPIGDVVNLNSYDSWDVTIEKKKT